MKHISPNTMNVVYPLTSMDTTPSTIITKVTQVEPVYIYAGIHAQKNSISNYQHTINIGLLWYIRKTISSSKPTHQSAAPHQQNAKTTTQL